MNQKDNFYIDLVGQIMDGFSTVEWGNHTIYIKHHNFRDQAQLTSDFEKYKDEAVLRGIPTEEQAIRDAIERGDWSQNDEDYIQKEKEKITALINAANQMIVPSQKEQQMKMVNSLRAKIKEKEKERNSLIDNSAESLGYIRANNRFMEKVMFSDPEFKNPIEKDENFKDKDLAVIRNMQMSLYSTFNEKNMSEAVLADFFSSYLAFSDDPMKLFGIPAMRLTIFQLKLISLARMFQRIFENYSDIPDLIRKDPEAIIQFVKAKQDEDKRERFTKHRKGDHQATTYFGANKDDIQKMRGSGERVVRLSDEVKKRGGSMNIQQLMEMTGADK